MIKPFDFASTPHIHFGAGCRNRLADILRPYGSRLLLVTGAASFDRQPQLQRVLDSLQADFEVFRVKVEGEPSPELVDQAVAEFRPHRPDCVLTIGGGSAVDAGKAIAGLLPGGDSVMEYLEGVGRGKAYAGVSTPFVAVPTTAGTGGETSKNAVLSVIGPGGFKKSFRHEALVPRHVVLDPELTLSCPPHVTAACGMDALTQLLESYVSCKANPMTDALALGALRRIATALPAVVRDGRNLAARADMLYASSISGLTLANAGLGSVHGLASPLGAFFPIPHGAACATLLPEAVRVNIRALQAREPSHEALGRYADAGRILLADQHLDDDTARAGLPDLLDQWLEEMKIPRLSHYGVGEGDIGRLIDHVSGGSMSGNPIRLERREIAGLIRSRL